MRIVAAAFLAAVILLMPGSVAADSLAAALSVKAPAPESSQPSAAPAQFADNNTDSFHKDQFVYIPPPESKKVDPRFYADTYEFVPTGEGPVGGVLVQPKWGAIPVGELDVPPAPTAQLSVAAAQSIVTQPDLHKPTAAPREATNTVTQPTVTQRMEVPIAYGTIPASSISSAPLIVPAKAAVTPTPSSTPAPKATNTATSAPTSTATSPASNTATATPSSTAKATATVLVIKANSQGSSADDIEDPRFYRGSYVYDAETRTLKPGMIDAPPSVPGESPAKPTSATGQGCSGNCTPSASSSRGGFPRSGRAMYYNPGIMEQVLAFRLMAGHVNMCYECVGYVALLDAADLNRKVWIVWGPDDVEGPFLVIDAAAKQHVASLIQRNWVIDVDYQTAMRRGMNRPLPVTVWDRPPSGSYAAGGG